MSKERFIGTLTTLSKSAAVLYSAERLEIASVTNIDRYEIDEKILISNEQARKSLALNAALNEFHGRHLPKTLDFAETLRFIDKAYKESLRYKDSRRNWFIKLLTPDRFDIMQHVLHEGHKHLPQLYLLEAIYTQKSVADNAYNFLKHLREAIEETKQYEKAKKEADGSIKNRIIKILGNIAQLFVLLKAAALWPIKMMFDITKKFTKIIPLTLDSVREAKHAITGGNKIQQDSDQKYNAIYLNPSPIIRAISVKLKPLKMEMGA
jgi:hypothetical protein